MLSKMYVTSLVVLGCASGLASAQTTAQTSGTISAPSSGARVVSVQSTPTPVMQALMDSAQDLRESVQALAQRPPGHERDVAINKAKLALARTQRAMLDLPPEYQYSGTTPGTGTYDRSVRDLMQAADGLRTSIHAMARMPAGEQRTQSIRDANKALLDAQVAMANAYDLTAFGSNTKTTTMGGSSGCTQQMQAADCQHPHK